MIVLGTDVLSIVQRAAGLAYDGLGLGLDAADDEVAVSIVSFEEQMRGWLAYIARAKSANQQIEGYDKLHALLDDFTPHARFSTSTNAAPPSLSDCSD